MDWQRNRARQPWIEIYQALVRLLVAQKRHTLSVKLLS